MICSNCGTQFPDSAKFCPNCGTAVAQSDPEPVSNPAPEPAPEPSPEPSAQQAYPNYTAPNQNTSGYQAYTPYTNGTTFYDVGIQPRDIAVAIILSIVTCGIYNIYWFIKMVDDVNRAANDQSAFSGGVTWLLSFVTGGIYGCYWYYQAGKKMAYAKQVRNMPVDNSAEILYLILAIFGLGIVNMALIQSDLNKMATPQN